MCHVGWSKAICFVSDSQAFNYKLWHVIFTEGKTTHIIDSIQTLGMQTSVYIKLQMNPFMCNIC